MHPSSSRPSDSRRLARRRAFTAVEILITLAVSLVLMAAVMQQMIESLSISLKVSRNLDHARTTRVIIDRMTRDFGAAQSIVLYPSFGERSTVVGADGTGTYLVLHEIAPTGLFLRTVGYYLVPGDLDNEWMLFVHDSARGDSAAGVLPAAGSSGTHEMVTHSVHLQTPGTLFRKLQERGIVLRGEFGTTGPAANGRSEFIQCAFATRS